MIISYNKDSGRIEGTSIGADEMGLFEEPTIKVPDDTDTSNKKVDVETEELVWETTLHEAKSDKIQEIKDRAYEVLSETDWYITREQEMGEPIPQDVLDHRSQVRSDSNNFEQEVNNLETVEDVLNYEYSFPDPPQ
jgi:hypothetical protein